MMWSPAHDLAHLARFNDGRFRVTTEAQLRARARFVFTGHWPLYYPGTEEAHTIRMSFFGARVISSPHRAFLRRRYRDPHQYRGGLGYFPIFPKSSQLAPSF